LWPFILMQLHPMAQRALRANKKPPSAAFHRTLTSFLISLPPPL
jgi:hypothetical protein